MNNSKFDRGVVLGLAGIVALLIVSAVLSYLNVRQLNEDARWVAHTHEVMDTLEIIHGHLREAEAVQRTYLITGGTMPTDFADNVDSAQQNIGQAKLLTTDNPEQQARIADVEKRFEELNGVWSRTAAIRRQQGFDAVQKIVLAGQSRKMMSDLHGLIRQMGDAERLLLRDRKRKTEQAYFTAIATGIVTAVLGLAVVAMFIWLLGRHLRARQRAATMIHEQRQLLQATLASIGDGVVTTEVEGRVTFLNDVAQKLTGWTPDEAMGMPLEQVFRIVNEDTRKPVENPAMRALAEGKIVGLANHTILIAKDGAEWPLDDSAAPIRDENGAVSGAVLVFREVNERREKEQQLAQREQQFRTLADSIPQLTWMANPDGHVFWYNRRWYEYTGTTFEQMEGWGWQSLHDPNELPKVVERWKASIATGEPFDMVFPLKGADGVFRPFLTLIVPIKDEEGRVVRWFGTNTDITQAKRTEEELRDARQRIQIVLESINDAFFAVDRNWRFTYVNHQAERLLDRKPGDLLGKIIWEVYPGLVGSDFERAYRHVATERATVSITSYYPDHDRWYEVHVYPATDGISIYFRDVSGRKRAEAEMARLTQAAEQQRRIYETALSNNADFNYVFDLRGRFVYVNKALLALWGKKLHQAVGKDFHELDYPPELAQRLQQQIQSVIDTKQPLTDETPYSSAVGERQYEYIFVPVLGEGGKVEAVAGSTRDITERKRTEEALKESQRFLRSSLDALENRIAVLDEAGTILEVNEAWRRFTDQNHFVGSGCAVGTDYLMVCEKWTNACGDGTDIANGIREVMAGRQDRFKIEYPCHSATEQRWFLMQATRFQSPGPVRVVVAHENVTERRLAEEALRDADRRKDEFLATLAHELRNPLAPIRNGLQMIRVARGNRDTVEQARTMMDRQLTQLVRLVDDLMDVSRISRGKIELRKEHVQLTAVVNSAVETSRPLIQQMGHELTVTLPKSPILVDADLTRLAQVFLNLLNNAAKYTERGGRIWLIAERQGSDVVVSVKDTGIGIAPDQLPRLFEMFSQLDHSLERSQGGLGIGLMLVKRLVEMHGGTVEARSEGAGKGSEFIVRLPAVVQASSPQPPRREEPAGVRSSLRILVVDDNRDGADSLSMMLRIMGNDTRTAYDGEEAVTAAGEFRPDVILLDIGLPKLTGYEACRLIREQSRDNELVIVAQTGWGQEEDRHRTHEAGFDHHMVKPVDPQTLMQLLADFEEGMREEERT